MIVVLFLFYLQDRADLLNVLSGVDPKRSDPGKGALKLMNKLFTDDEMSQSCYSNAHGRSTKQELDRKRKAVLEGKLHSGRGCETKTDFNR